MNNLSEYIKMSKKADEIQRQHKPKECDLYVCACSSCKESNREPFKIESYDIDCLNKRDLTNVEPHYAHMVMMSDMGGFVAYYNERTKNYLSYIWLPTQAQLQNMVKDKFTMLGLIDCFAQWCQMINQGTEINDYIKYFTSIEQLWLAFTMAELYLKYWNSKDWVKK